MASNRTPAPSRNAQAALGLKVAGASYDDIARTLGFANEVEAREAVERVLAAQARDIDPATKTRERALADARIDRLLRAVAPRALDPRDPEQLSAARVCLSLFERHARLWGLDAPTQVAVTTPTTAEIDRWVAAVLATQAQTVTVEEPDVIVVPGEVVTDDPAA